MTNKGLIIFKIIMALCRIFSYRTINEEVFDNDTEYNSEEYRSEK